MTIRSAKEEDTQAICELVESLSHYYLEQGVTELPAWFKLTMTTQVARQRINNPDFLSYVYTDKGNIIGYISIKEHMHLYHLFVQEDFQGRGIARQLWHYACNESSAKYFTVRSSINAVPIYAKFGFQVVGAVDNKDGISYQIMEWKYQD